MAHRNKITFIVVPCWWDGMAESLASTISFQRPDLIPTSIFEPIALNPPHSFFRSIELPDVGELMLASFPMDPKFSNSIQDNFWWMGEKFDGIRFCWNPILDQVLSRGGKEILLHSKLKENLPKSFLEGELWFGRGQFQFTYMFFKNIVELVAWHMLRVVCFDSPTRELQTSTFEKRYTFLLAVISPFHSACIVVPRVLCKSSKHLHMAVAGIIDDGGEGSILRKVGSIYEHGRNSSLIKLKTSHGDKEGLVVQATQKGVTLKLPTGQLLDVPTSNVQIPLPKEGDVVTFSYEIHTRRELPVNPVILRLRSDVSWEEAVASSRSQKQFLNEQSTTDNYTAKPRGYWTLANMKAYMMQLAQSYKLDPLLPSTWHSIPFEAIYSTKSGRAILQKFKGHFMALKSLFPNIGLEDRVAVEQSSWNDKRKRRRFFESYAKEKGFDPHKPENWYSHPRSKILASKGAHRIILYHKNSVAKALVDLFPEIGLKIIWFRSPPRNIQHRRGFFEDFAKANDFDPYIAKNWYLQSRRAIVAHKDSRQILTYYKENISKALLDVFPNIGLDKSKLWIRPSISRPLPSSRHDIGRRLFFEKYAADNQFDPLIPQNWYNQSKAKISRVKGALTVLCYHGNSSTQALLDLFPEIGLERSKFRAQWHETSTRRAFFEDYATTNRFDPLNPYNWYLQPRERLISCKGSLSVMQYHHGSLTKALMDLFPDIGLDESNFLDRSSWSKQENRRKFFEMFAKANSFDSLIADNWYKQSAHSIMAAKGASSVMIHHGHKITKALMDLFPEIGLKKSQLRKNGHNVYSFRL